jgi:Putative cyclase
MGGRRRVRRAQPDHPEKRVQAASLVRLGRTVSMSRPFPKEPSPINPFPALHYMNRGVRETGGSAVDFYGIAYQGMNSTHIDSLCHVWDENGMYNGRKADEVITYRGATFGQIDNWRDGIVTRGVLLDVPRFRGTQYVAQDKPVHGWELEQVAKAQGVQLTPGDALVVYSGREAWTRAAGRPWGSGVSTAPEGHVHGPDRLGLRLLPGVHPGDRCLRAGLGHDGRVPQRRGAAVDGAWRDLHLRYRPARQRAARAARRDLRGRGRSEFMFVTSPLGVEGGTGSPTNPLAIL